jgi:hypothetical protein
MWRCNALHVFTTLRSSTIALCAVHADPAAAQPLKSDSDGSGDAGDTLDEETAELHELLQQMRDPAVRC